MKAGVKGSIRVETRNRVAVHAIDRAERAPDKHLAIALHRERPNLAVGTGKSVLKFGVKRAVRIEPCNIVTDPLAIDCIE